MIKGERWHRRTQKKKQNERRKENEEEWRGKEQKEGKRNRIEHEAATWLYRWEVTSSQHYTTSWGCEEISIGKIQRGAILFSIFFQSLLPSYSLFTWFFFCNLDCYPSTLSFSWKEGKVGCPLLTSLISNGWRTEADGPSPSFIRQLHTTRNYLTRITLQTGIEDWRMTRVVAS